MAVAEWTPTFIDAADTFTVPADVQLIAVAPIRVDGTLVLDGILIFTGTGAGSSGSGATPTLVRTGRTFVVRADTQMLATIPIRVDGTLVVDGVLVLADLSGGSSAGAVNERATVTVTTGVLLAGQSELGVLPMAKTYRVFALSTSKSARVRLYATVADQAADVNRVTGVDPDWESGVLLDFVALEGHDYTLSPFVDGMSLDEPPSASIPMTTTKLTGPAGPVNVVVKFLRME